MSDVIIIGGGPAGVTAALRARELGADVTLFEKGRLGGTCLNDGVVPTRVWARAARLRRDFDQLSAYGWLAQPPDLFPDAEFPDLCLNIAHLASPGLP